MESIRSAVERAVDQLARDSAAGVGPDATAVATLEDGLRCRVRGPRGEVVTDMGESVGELAGRVGTRSAVGDALTRAIDVRTVLSPSGT